MYRVENDSTIRIVTLSFAMEVMAFGGPTTFSHILIIQQKNGNITQLMVIWYPMKLTTVKPFFLKTLFMFWEDKRLINQQVLQQKKATKSGHLIFLRENGQIEEKWALISVHTRQFKRIVFSF